MIDLDKIVSTAKQAGYLTAIREVVNLLVDKNILNNDLLNEIDKIKDKYLLENSHEPVSNS